MADPAQIAHLLRRTEYVARPERLAQLIALPTLEAAVDDILSVPAPVVLPSEIDHTVDGGEWGQYVFATKWWFDRMAFDSPRPVQEKMTFFWHGHFTSEWGKVSDTRAMMRQNKLYRDNALGGFAALAQTMAIEPAMLVYLDNADNSRKSPNQNFARELMELFLLGVGNYTEGDVEASARAWTGHTVDAAGLYWFRADRHDTGDKTFFGITKNWNGPDIINEILFGAKQQIVARYIVSKLWDFFAHPGAPTAVLDSVAPAFAANWDIKQALRSILLRPEFYSITARQGLVRGPVDWIVAVMVQTGYRAALLNPQWYVEGMGQTPFNPPNVSGWRPNGAWINTSAMGTRAEFARSATWRLRDDDLAENVGRGDMSSLATMPISEAIDTVAALFALEPLSDVTRSALTNYLVAQRASKPWPDWWEPTLLLTMAMIAPEMHVA